MAMGFMLKKMNGKFGVASGECEPLMHFDRRKSLPFPEAGSHVVRGPNSVLLAGAKGG